MNQDILLSKIVPNPTDTTWSQAYTTLNVYMAISIEKEESKTPVTQHGKQLLEKLQREFFALDDKSLDNIKKAVHNATSHIGDEYKYSVIVGAIVGDVLYIVLASEGQVIIKRGEKVGVVATGIEKELHGFSGKLKHDDIVILETGDFSKKISLSTISEQLTSNDVIRISENITPLIHDGSKGTETAIILQFKDHQKSNENIDAIEDAVKDDVPIEDDEIDMMERKSDFEEENLWTKPPKEDQQTLESVIDDKEDMSQDRPRKLPSISIPKINFANKKLIIVFAIIVLVLLLIGGISYQVSSSNDAKRTAEFSKIYDPLKIRYDEASQLGSLNKTLALEEYNELLELVNQALANYEEGSEEHQKISELKSQIESSISSLGGGSSASNVEELLAVGNEIKSITAITSKGGSLIILDKTGQQVATINEDGSIDEIYDIESEADFVSADDKYIYAMGETVVSIDRGNGSTSEIMDDIDGSAFDIFGSNLYTLNGDDILKYRSPAYEGISYFTSTPKFPSSPIDIAISGPIYVLSSNGQVSRFNKGEQEDFQLAGITAPIADGSKIYAEPNLDNFYILDVKNQRVVSFDEEGEYITQYEGSFMKDAISFAIDEENKYIYVLSSNKVFRFDL